MLEEEALTKQDAAREERQEELERTFSYDGYQVVRKELFAHLRDPAIVIRNDSITFNTACIAGLENVVYVHVMFNKELKRLVVRGCNENDKDALRWCIEKPDKRKSRKMSCRPFSELVYNEMGWDKSCRYKILGYRICFEGITLYVFDLLVPEIFHETSMPIPIRNGFICRYRKPRKSRTATSRKARHSATLKCARLRRPSLTRAAICLRLR